MQTLTLHKNTRGVCAFCRHWYDPTNSHIAPKHINTDVWEYDRDARCKCRLTNIDKFASSNCPKYECKIELNKR